MGRFQKGQSGNPNGRPKKSKNLFDAEQACKGLAPDAFKTLSELLDSDNETIRLKAVQMILDRAYGKPKQAIDADITSHVLKPPQLIVNFTDVPDSTEQ